MEVAPWPLDGTKRQSLKLGRKKLRRMQMRQFGDHPAPLKVYMMRFLYPSHGMRLGRTGDR